MRGRPSIERRGRLSAREWITLRWTFNIIGRVSHFRGPLFARSSNAYVAGALGPAPLFAPFRRDLRLVVQGGQRKAQSQTAGTGEELSATTRRIGAPAAFDTIVRNNERMKKVVPHLVPKIAAATLTACVLLSAGCHRGLPSPSSAEYHEFISAFYVGLAALQVGDDVRAESALTRATQLAPGEPAGWADWGILALRQRNFDLAAQRLDRARRLEPKNDHIDYLLGILASNRGDPAGAITYLREAVHLNPANLQAEYQLALEVERQGGADSEAEFQKLITQILDAQPRNLAALLELSRVAAKRGDAATLRSAVTGIAAQSTSWPQDARDQLAQLEAAVSGPPAAAAIRSIFLRNVLMQLPSFRESIALIKPAPGDEAQPFTHLLRLASPPGKPAPPDVALHFECNPIASLSGEKWDWIGAISLNGEGAPTVAAANAREVRLTTGARFAFPGGRANAPPSPESVLPVDFNYDFKTDLVLAGAGGVRFMRQDDPTKFTDVTAQTRLPKGILTAPYTGAWAVDIEADGDLDIVLGAAGGVPTVLRNNGDGTFKAIHPFAGVSGIRQFVRADLNGDGNPDAALIDGVGRLHVFLNQRLGNFAESTLPAGFSDVRAIAAADASYDGILDLLAVESSGSVVRLSNRDGSWKTDELLHVPDPAQTLSGDVRLRVADLDNNGAFDLLLVSVGKIHAANGALIWLGDQNQHFDLLESRHGPARVFDAAPVSAEGRFDLLGLTSDGQPSDAVNRTTKNYHWQIIRPRAHQATGDQRINSFGIGGEIEIRSGLLVQTQPIDGPQLHFGLGNETGAEVARLVWPNGTVRAEFALKADQEFVAEQRLKGSCPFLFAWNGKSMEFVKDAVPWGSALGLRIDAMGPARIAATREWYKIPGSDLAPRNGSLDLSFTGELWETYYYDYLSLMAVDHPAGTEVFTDERFVMPPVKLAVTTVAEPHPIARAVDDLGNNVTEILRNLDGNYLDTFGRGQYQGVTRDHYVEIDLGDDVPASGPLWLIARGWLHPSDSSINVAIAQGSTVHPRPLSLEVADGHGGWRVARPNLGFPAGRNKTCLIDLTGLFRASAPHRLRLRTNLEIYWDQIEWAQGLPDAPTRITRLAPQTADLHYRGFSAIHQANASSPEIPDYYQLAATTQIWRDLEGFYTRYGDVRELLAGIDDRYVMMNAGDELSLSFAAPPPPPAGWVRDYVIDGDGWIKDGDYNSAFSRTVQPLPYHARTEYDTPPGALEDERVYKQHPQDWQNYQTRYVTPDVFLDALRSGVTK
jgi:Flp pilus assembly protein TadD